MVPSKLASILLADALYVRHAFAETVVRHRTRQRTVSEALACLRGAHTYCPLLPASSAMSTVAAMSQHSITEQQRARYLALKPRMDALTVGTHWHAHRGKGLHHILTYIQSRPQPHCCHQSLLDEQRADSRAEDFAAPETFDDDGSDDSSVNSEEDSAMSTGRPSQHDSSSSSPIIYLSAPPTSNGVPTTPLPAATHHSPNSFPVQLPSPIPHTPPAADRSDSNSPTSTSPPLSSGTSASSLSAAASYTTSPSSSHSYDSGRSMATASVRRGRSRHCSHSPSLSSTPISASIDGHQQTLSVYWPWSDDHSVECSAVSRRQPGAEEDSKADERPYNEQSEDAEADEMQPGMPVREEACTLSCPITQATLLSAACSSPSSPGVEEESHVYSRGEHDHAVSKGAKQATDMQHVVEPTSQANSGAGCADCEPACGTQLPEREEEQEEEEDDAQQQLNSTGSSFAVAAIDEMGDDNTGSYRQSNGPVAVEDEFKQAEAGEKEQLTRQSVDVEAMAAQVEDADEQQGAESPTIPIRRTAARRRVLVSDDDDDSDTSTAAAARTDKPAQRVDVADGMAEEVVDVSEDDSPAIVPRGRGHARRRQIVSDDDGDEDANAHKQRTTHIAIQHSPLRDITNRSVSSGRPLVQPFPSPPPKPQLISNPLFATPAPRSVVSRWPAASHFTHAVDGGGRTRSVTRSGRRRGGRVACDEAEEEDEMDLHATPMIERIRQHKAALYNQQAVEEEEQEQEAEEDEDEYDQSFIASESEADESIDIDDENDHDSDDPSVRITRSPLPRSRPPASSTRRPPPSSSKAAAHSRNTACPALTKHNRVQLARDVYCSFNQLAFNDRLPAELPIEWCNKLSTTAGHCRLMNGSSRGCIITLAVKVIDSYERLRKTLAHEMCHAAAWLIDGCNRPPHGRTFRHYAQLCERRLPSLTISTCHTYAIYYPWRYRCTAPHCGQEVGRHTDSLDVEASRCGRCGGRLVRLGKFARDGTPVAVRQVKGFAAFVKAQQARVRAENPGTPQRAVMGLLSAEWKRQRAAEVVLGGSVAEGDEHGEEGEQADEEEQLVQRMLDMDVVDE